jgi:hypothetical protein
METNHRDFELQDRSPKPNGRCHHVSCGYFDGGVNCALGPGEQRASARSLELSVGRFFTDSLTQGSSCQDTR